MLVEFRPHLEGTPQRTRSLHTNGESSRISHFRMFHPPAPILCGEATSAANCLGILALYAAFPRPEPPRLGKSPHMHQHHPLKPSHLPYLALSIPLHIVLPITGTWRYSQCATCTSLPSRHCRHVWAGTARFSLCISSAHVCGTWGEIGLCCAVTCRRNYDNSPEVRLLSSQAIPNEGQNAQFLRADPALG